MVGEASLHWELKKEERKAEMDLIGMEIKEAKECMQALKKIAVLRQKEWELARAHGKQEEELQVKLLDAREEP